MGRPEDVSGADRARADAERGGTPAPPARRTIWRVTSRPAAAPRLRDLARLRRVRDRIDREYAQPLDVEALARGAYLSAGHLSRQFRLAFGESPYAYLMTRRIERAMALLRRGELSVTSPPSSWSSRCCWPRWEARPEWPPAPRSPSPWPINVNGPCWSRPSRCGEAWRPRRSSVRSLGCIRPCVRRAWRRPTPSGAYDPTHGGPWSRSGARGDGGRWAVTTGGRMRGRP